MIEILDIIQNLFSLIIDDLDTVFLWLYILKTITGISILINYFIIKEILRMRKAIKSLEERL